MSPWSRRAIRRLADCGQEGLESGLPRRARVRADPGHDACVCAGSWTPLRGEFDSDCGIGPDGPGLDVIGIRPHEVAEAAFVRNLLPPINQPHLVDRAELWRESTVHTQDAAVHDGGEGAPARRRSKGSMACGRPRKSLGVSRPSPSWSPHMPRNINFQKVHIQRLQTHKQEEKLLARPSLDQSAVQQQSMLTQSACNQESC